jgi:phage-related protein
MASKSLTFDLFGRDRSASKTIAGVGDAAQNMGKTLGVVAGAIAAGFAAMKIGEWAKESIDALAEWEKINAQTNAVVASTGGAANVTAAHVHDLAQAIEATTATQAESIQEGANLLLTFKNIRNEAGEGNDIFDQSTKALVDMARAMGTDAPASAIQLGKALNDPIAGIAALSRVGIQFTDDQKNLIKTLVESGDTLGAQKIILAELNAQFGGSGAAYADTYAGKIFLLQDAWGDLGETLFSAIFPALKAFADVATQALTQVADSPTFQRIVDWFVKIGEQATAVLSGLPDFVSGLWDETAVDPLGDFVSKLGELSPVLAIVAELFEALRPVFPDIMDAVKEIAPLFADLVVALLPLLPPLVEMITTLLPPLVDILIRIVNDGLVPLMPYLGEFVNWIAGIVGWLGTPTDEAMGGLATWFETMGPIGEAFGAVLRAVGDFLSQGFVGAIKSVVEWVGSAWTNLWTTVGSTVTVGVNNVVSFVSGIPGAVIGALSGAGSWLLQVGKDIVQGLIDGAASMVEDAVAAVKNVGASMLQGVKDFLGIKSPSRVFRDQVGKQMGLGLIEGINSMQSGAHDAVNRLVTMPDVSDFASLGGSQSASAGGSGLNIRVIHGLGDKLSELVQMEIQTASGWQSINLKSGVAN